MRFDWIQSPAAKQIVRQMADRRPTWLWSADGETLILRNPAARLFKAKAKKDRLKPAKDAVPIKGQIRRLMRLGSVGLSSPARVQFLVGQKPVSATCICTPLLLDNDEPALLIVGVNPIKHWSRRSLDMPDPHFSTLLSNEVAHVFYNKKGQVVTASQAAAAYLAKKKFSGQKKWRSLVAASKNKLGLAIRTSEKDAGQPVESQIAVSVDRSQEETAHKTEQAAKIAPAREEPVREVSAAPSGSRKPALSGLLDQLANGSNLFAPLDGDHEEQEEQAQDFSSPGTQQHTPEEKAQEQTEPEQDLPVAKTQNPEIDISAAPDPTVQWRVTGKGFSPEAASASVPSGSDADSQFVDLSERGARAPSNQEAKAEDDQAASKDVDQVARYNFDELSRILVERVGEEHGREDIKPSLAPSEQTAAPAQSKTIKLSEELLVLNRLPIGILIFRDQSILFANRALADIMGSPNISRLRDSGLEAIFPQVKDDAAALGPVANLLDMEGREIPVTARLQTIVWQGAPALMLSALKREPGGGDGETSVTAFVRAQAAAQEFGYFEAGENGNIEYASKAMGHLLDQGEQETLGQTLARLIAPQDQTLLKEFLAQPAKFAETKRPSIVLSAAKRGMEVHMFTRGRAGVVSGYFGTVSPQPASENSGSARTGNLEISLLKRLSRGIRQPLNSILGFSDLMLSETSSKMDVQRYREYVRDIKRAGDEISHLTDEMDEYVDLETSEKSASAADLDLAGLLDECMRLVRRQASRRQVFVRSAISQNLSTISADRATMRQAILNLLASAIDQTPAGGKVILSAQSEPDGTIGIHVRSSDTQPGEPGDRFVVFRENNSRRGEALVPLKSSMGLTLTRSLLAANSCTLSIDPSGGVGTLMTLVIPAERTSGSAGS